MAIESNTSVQLDYLGKVHSGLREAGQRIHSTVVVQSFISLVAIALVLRIVRTDAQYEAAGLTLRADSAFILVALSIAAGALLAYLIGLMQHEADMRDLTVQLYRDQGFAHTTLDAKLINPLEYPHIITVIQSLAQRPALPHMIDLSIKGLTRIAILALMLGLPIAAQILAVWDLSYSGSRWAGAACGLIALLPLAYLYIFVKTP